MSNGAATAESASANGTGQPSLSAWLAPLRRSPLVPLLIAGAAVIAIAAALLMWANAPEYRVLYSNLNDADGGRIIGELEQMGIPYKFSAGGQALMVPGDQVHSLRLRLAEQGLPEAGNVGFEIMDNQAFGVSQFTERVNFQRGLEGELASSIQSLGPVSRARVHLAMARPSVFVREHQPARASVVLTLQPGRALGDGQVNAVVHMVSSSVPDLALEDITVVDQDGRLLSRSGQGNQDLDGTQLDYVRQVEQGFRQRIEAILAPILGKDNIRAQVTAQVDFTEREETSETYEPNQGENPAAVRSSQWSSAVSGGDDLAAGIPGALSNTPPGSAPSPVAEEQAEENPDNAQGPGNVPGQGPAQAADTAQGPDRLQRDNVVNYEVDRNVIHTQYRQGNIERLSAAVVINYQQGTNDEGEVVQEPLPDEQIQRIGSLVRQAMGFSEARGDALEVVNSPFTQSEPEVAEPVWWQSAEVQHLILTFGRYLLAILVLWLLYRWLLKPLMERYSHAQRPAAPAPSVRATVGDDEDSDGEDSGEEEREEPEPQPNRRRQKSSQYQHNLEELREMAVEDPAIVAMIVRNWMSDHHD